MTTREEMAEACRAIRETCSASPDISGKHAGFPCFHALHMHVDAAASQLKRDGLLRERLAAYANDLLESGDPEEAFIKREIGETIEALLKEFP